MRACTWHLHDAQYGQRTKHGGNIHERVLSDVELFETQELREVGRQALKLIVLQPQLFEPRQLPCQE